MLGKHFKMVFLVNHNTVDIIEECLSPAIFKATEIMKDIDDILNDIVDELAIIESQSKLGHVAMPMIRLNCWVVKHWTTIIYKPIIIIT